MATTSLSEMIVLSVAIRAFWDWFVQHEDEVAAQLRDAERLASNFDSDIFRRRMDQLFHLVNGRMAQVDSRVGIVFGMGPARGELVVTAEGRRDAFAVVRKVCKAAPTLRHFHVVFLKPRMSSPDSVVKFANVTLMPRDILFMLERRGDRAELGLVVPHIHPEQTPAVEESLRLAVLQMLGEYDGSRVGNVNVVVMPEGQDIHASKWTRSRPLTELAAAFDAVFPKAVQ